MTAPIVGKPGTVSRALHPASAPPKKGESAQAVPAAPAPSAARVIGLGEAPAWATVVQKRRRKKGGGVATGPSDFSGLQGAPSNRRDAIKSAKRRLPKMAAVMTAVSSSKKLL